MLVVQSNRLMWHYYRRVKMTVSLMLADETEQSITQVSLELYGLRV